MGLFDFFPYTSGHTFNLDWIIKTVKKLGGDFQIFKDEINAKVATTIPAEVASKVAEAVSGITAADINALPGIESAEYPGCYYRSDGGAVEWLNPPLLVGIEYRTTGRWNGKPVYTKLIDCGALPDKSTKIIDMGIGNYNPFWIDGFVTNSLGSSTTFSTSTAIDIGVNGKGELLITTSYDFATVNAHTAIAAIKYAKD